MNFLKKYLEKIEQKCLKKDDKILYNCFTWYYSILYYWLVIKTRPTLCLHIKA